jgi:PhnB protein
MIDYEDAERAIDFLSRAFGFVEDRSQRYTEPDGRISHAQLTLDGGSILLGGSIDGYQGPDRHASVCDVSRGWLNTPYIVDGVLVCVDDVHSHFDRARQAGAEILSSIEEGGPGTRYRVADVEGHRWMFMQRP